MNMWITYGIIAVILIIAELIYFRIAEKIRGRFFDPFLIKGLKYPVRNKSH